MIASSLLVVAVAAFDARACNAADDGKSASCWFVVVVTTMGCCWTTSRFPCAVGRR